MSSHNGSKIIILVVLVFVSVLGCSSTESNKPNYKTDTHQNNQENNRDTHPKLSELQLTTPQPMSLFNIGADGTEQVTIKAGNIKLFSNSEAAYSQVYSKPEQYTYPQNTKPARFGEQRDILPTIQFDFVIEHEATASKTKAKIVPLTRHLILTEHPTWDYFVGVGEIIKQSSGHLISIPFALVEKNQNCVHNGALLVEQDESRKLGQFYYQISSETCAYYQADIWGSGEAQLTSSSINRLEQRPDVLHSKSLADLSEMAPEIELSKLRLQHLIPKQDMSALGVIHKGMHYAQECNTRAGLSPFCSQLVLPSYSMAKSIFAGLVAMHLQKEYGDVFEQPLNKWIKQCASKANQANWQGVTFAHLLNMTTGNYNSKIHGVDEGAAHTANFFSVATHEQKLAYACNQFTRKKQPGQEFVYHTSDTYLLGAALQAYWQAKQGKQADIFNDILVNNIFKQANLSQVSSKSRRTQGEKAQLFAGYGLFLLPSDIAKLSNLLVANIRDTHPNIGAELEGNKRDTHSNIGAESERNNGDTHSNIGAEFEGNKRDTHPNIGAEFERNKRDTHSNIGAEFEGNKRDTHPNIGAEFEGNIRETHRNIGAEFERNNRDTHLFDSAEFAKVMQPNRESSKETEFQNIRYVNGFWLYNLKDILRCKQDKFVPYMMGYGGLALVFLSADTQFYYVSDSGQYAWRDAAIELNKLSHLCR